VKTARARYLAVAVPFLFVYDPRRSSISGEVALPF
jgi:hypothetical protein